MARDEAMRTERFDSLFVADHLLDDLVFDVANYVKNKELDAKVTPFAMIHTHFTMEGLFNFMYTLPD